MQTSVNFLKSAFLFFGALFLVLRAASPAAHAFNAAGYQWPAGQIHLILALGSAGRTLSDGKTS